MSASNVNNGSRTRNTSNQNQVGQGVGSVGVGDVSASARLGNDFGNDSFDTRFTSGDFYTGSKGFILDTPKILAIGAVGIAALVIYKIS